MNAKNGSDKKKRMMSLEVRQKIIRKQEQDARGVDLPWQYDR